jgi:K+-transporting ATPase ATPase B chain
MGLQSRKSDFICIFNAIIIPILIPLALKGVDYKPIGASAILKEKPIDLWSGD